jgi:hypothetical protein
MTLKRFLLNLMIFRGFFKGWGIERIELRWRRSLGIFDFFVFGLGYA